MQKQFDPTHVKDGLGGFGAYTATKHGLVGLSKTIAAEFGRDGIRCNAICPGFVRTEMHLDATRRLAAQEGIGEAEMAARRYADVPLGRAGEPDEIARLVILLAGPGGAYITGTAIPVAGGHPVGL